MARCVSLFCGCVVLGAAGRWVDVYPPNTNLNVDDARVVCVLLCLVVIVVDVWGGSVLWSFAAAHVEQQTMCRVRYDRSESLQVYLLVYL